MSPLSPSPLLATSWRRTLCRSCLARLGPKTGTSASPSPRRWISRTWLAKQAMGEEKWQERAEKIKKGEMQNPFDFLRERGFVKDLAGTEKQIRELMRIKRIGVYVGVDPTAPSMHIGHLVPLIALFFLHGHGYRTVSVIGGATCKVGDPTGRLKGRDKNMPGELNTNVAKVHYQLKRIWQNAEQRLQQYGFSKDSHWQRGMLNNSMWLRAVGFAEVVSLLFNGVRVGPMLSRDTVRQRLENDSGMSLDEFVYPLMQAWDWWYLFDKQNVRLQIGGSDQYGNLVTGIDAVKHLRDTVPMPNESDRLKDTLENSPVGFTTPLLTDASGNKLGKSAGNAVWLDPFMTSSVDLYGYFMRRPDSEVENLLRLTTLMPNARIAELMEAHEKDPSKRVPHHALAYEVVSLVHNVQLANGARHDHIQRFSLGKTAASMGVELPNSQKEVEYSAVPQDGSFDPWRTAQFRHDMILPQSLMYGTSIPRILHAAGLATSPTDAVRLLKTTGAVRVAAAPGQKSAVNRGMTSGDLTWTPAKHWNATDTRNFVLEGDIMMLRRGKNFVRIIKIVTDDEWHAKGQTYAGEPYKGKTRVLRDRLRELDSKEQEENEQEEGKKSKKRFKTNAEKSDIADLRDNFRDLEGLGGAEEMEGDESMGKQSPFQRLARSASAKPPRPNRTKPPFPSSKGRDDDGKPQVHFPTVGFGGEGLRRISEKKDRSSRAPPKGHQRAVRQVKMMARASRASSTSVR